MIKIPLKIALFDRIVKSSICFRRYMEIHDAPRAVIVRNLHACKCNPARVAGLMPQGKQDLAVPLYERALDIRLSVFKPDHPDVTDLLQNLADALRATGGCVSHPFVRSLLPQWSLKLLYRLLFPKNQSSLCESYLKSLCHVYPQHLEMLLCVG